MIQIWILTDSVPDHSPKLTVPGVPRAEVNPIHRLHENPATIAGRHTERWKVTECPTYT